MTLLLALLSLAAYFAMPAEWRVPAARPGTTWLQVSARLPASIAVGVRLALILIIPMVVLGIILQAFREVGLSVLTLLPAALVLLMVFGDSQQPVAAPVSPDDGDDDHGDEHVPDVTDSAMVRDAVEVSATNVRELLLQARRRVLSGQLTELFSPLFWLLLASPVAALGYYLVRRAEQHPEEAVRDLATRWRDLADWLPTRLLALSLALAGNFKDTWQVIRERLLKPEVASAELLDQAAEAAEPADLDVTLSPSVGLEQALLELSALLQRALIVWMVMLALHTLWPGG